MSLTRLILSSLRSFTSFVGGALALVGAALACGAQGGRWSERLDVLAHFAPVWVALGLVGALLSLAGWGRRTGAAGAGLGLVAIVAAGSLMAPDLTRVGASSAGTGGPTLKVIQFNLWNQNLDPEGTFAWIRAQDADVIVIEEARGRSAALGARLREAYPHWSSCDVPRICSVMVLSRLPMLDRGSGRGPPTAWARYRWNGVPITVVGAHYFWPYPPGMQGWQSWRLADHIAPMPKDRMILAGDMNAAPWSFFLTRQDAAFGLERRTHALFSWPAARLPRIRSEVRPPFPFLPIDHIYAGPTWRTVSVRRGPRLGSDHYPVVVELAAR